FCTNYKILNINVRTQASDKMSFPQIKHPKFVGEYSLSPEVHFENSGARIRYLAQLPANLAQFSIKTNEDVAQNDNANCGYLDNMFYFLACSQERLQLLADIDIVCSREVLQLLMCSPYDYKLNWAIAVSKYRNTIFMCQVPHQRQAAAPSVDYDLLKKNIKLAWLKKLRQNCLLAMDNNIVLPGGYHSRQESGQYYGVFNMDICGIRLLFDAPVFAQQCQNSFIGVPKTFVDLQLRSDTMNRAEWTAHNRSEVLVWWVQCFLVGIDHIYIAYHDDEGTVHRIKNTAVRELWEECKNDWSPNLCANFLARFLGTVKKLLLPVNSASSVYLFEYDAKNGHISYKVTEECNEHSFIPDWFRALLGE
ncbi:hypothetical protein KR222_011643, partial [Zaprionus bogoriensis]